MEERFPLLDEKDLRLLSILEEDARLPWTRIAKMMGLSEATIYLRVKKLVNLGIIEGFTVKLNPKRLGLRHEAFVFIKVKAAKIQSVAKSLAKVKYGVEVYEVTGERQLLIKVLAPTVEDLSKTIDEIASIDGVEEVVTIYVLKNLKSLDRFTRVVKLS